MKRLIAGLAGVCLTMLPVAARAETVVSVIQTSYDANLRPQCVAVRMNTSIYGSLSSDACALGAASTTNGNDRITKTTYDAAGQVLEIDQAYGVTGVQRAYARYTYSDHGLKATETDANGNKTTYLYDGFDRVSQIQYPSATSGAGTADTTDYEKFGYDSNGNKTSWQRRNGTTINYTYDALNRETSRSASDKSVPVVYSDYDLLGHPCIVAFTTDVHTDGPDCTTLYSNLASTQGLHYKYDGLGRLAATKDMNTREVQYAYNEASVAKNLIYPDGANINYTRDSANRLTAIGYNASSGLIGEAYDNLGRRTSIIRRPDASNNAQAGSTSIGFDNFGRVTSLTDTLASASYSVTWGFTYNPASQIISTTQTNEAFTYGETSNSPTAETYDGLNRDQTLVGTSTACPVGGFDKNYNLICDGTRTFTYDVYNHLLTATGNNSNLKLVYDPLGRLAQYSSDGGSTYTDFLYDGTNLIGEYAHCTSTSCPLTPNERYIHGDNVDEPLVWFHGGDTSDERFFVQDYHGSVIAYTDASGNLVDLYKYGPYGEPKNGGNGTSFTGARFRYTGQVVIPEAQLYYYKARVYDPIYGRFLQTDPIGSKDDLDLYAYTADDPIDKTDPSGDCGVFIGACIGAAIGVGVEVYKEASSGELQNAYSAAKNGDWSPALTSGGKILKEGLIGGAAGLLGDGAGALAGKAAGTVLMGAGKAAQPWVEGAVGGAVAGGVDAKAHGQSAVKGALVGAGFGVAGKVVGKVFEAVGAGKASQPGDMVQWQPNGKSAAAAGLAGEKGVDALHSAAEAHHEMSCQKNGGCS